MGKLLDTLSAALDRADLAPADWAAADLALTYAEAIDDGGDLAKLGPAYLATLESLGMTQRGRKVPKPGEPAVEVSPLDELRARRVARRISV